VPLWQDRAYFQTPGHPAYDFWLAASFYTPQFNNYSCSAASSAMVLNSLIRRQKPSLNTDRNVTPQELADKNKNWRALVSEPGLDGNHGVTLSQLAGFIQNTFPSYLPGVAAEEREITSADDKNLALLRKALEENENNPNDFIIIHFVQNDLTAAPGDQWAHVSVIGAYDGKTRRVLVFDVDRDWYEPYWVADGKLLSAMAEKTDAFGFGGYIKVGIVAPGK
jgi:hypothetical protein